MFKEIIEENKKENKKENRPRKTAKTFNPFEDDVEIREDELEPIESSCEGLGTVKTDECEIEDVVTDLKAREKELIDVGRRAIRLGMGVIVVHGVEFEDGVVRCTCCNGKECENKGKHPLVSGWQKNAVRKEEELEVLFKNKGKYNIGLVMGGESRLIALDVDGEGGEFRLKEYEKKLGNLPATISNISPNGRHMFFKLPEGAVIKNKAKIGAVVKEKGEGLDVRSEGGFVVGPCSRHSKRALYKWGSDLEEDLFDCINSIPLEWISEFNNSISYIKSKVNRENFDKLDSLGDLGAFLNKIAGDGSRAKIAKLIAVGGTVDKGSRSDTANEFASSLNGSKVSLNDIDIALRLLNEEILNPSLSVKEIDNILKTQYGYRLKNIEGWKEEDLKKGYRSEYDINGNVIVYEKIIDVEEEVEVLEEEVLESVWDDSGTIGDDLEGEMDKVKGDDSMTSRIDVGAIRETDKGYVVNRSIKGEPYEKLITNFIIEPIYDVILDNESIMKINLKYMKNGVVKNREVSVCPKIFGSKKSMKEAISILMGSPAAINTISNEFEDLCMHISDRSCRCIEGVKTGGVVKHNSIT